MVVPDLGQDRGGGAHDPGVRGGSTGRGRCRAGTARDAQWSVAQIGDTKRSPLSRELGARVDFVATQGKAGSAPAETAVAYDRGYVVSRSGWGEERPLAQESHMILRFGDDEIGRAHV